MAITEEKEYFHFAKETSKYPGPHLIHPLSTQVHFKTNTNYILDLAQIKEKSI